MKTYHVRRRGAVHEAFVASETDRSEYEIARLPGGLFACACMAFVFNKDVPKSCKHIEAHRAGVALNVFGRHGGTSTVRAAGETYTFTRRAISLGPVPVR